MTLHSLASVSLLVSGERSGFSRTGAVSRVCSPSPGTRALRVSRLSRQCIASGDVYKGHAIQLPRGGFRVRVRVRRTYASRYASKIFLVLVGTRPSVIHTHISVCLLTGRNDPDFSDGCVCMLTWVLCRPVRYRASVHVPRSVRHRLDSANQRDTGYYGNSRATTHKPFIFNNLPCGPKVASSPQK